MVARKVVVINEMYSDNIGDQAISEAMGIYCNKNKTDTITKVDFSFRKSLKKKEFSKIENKSWKRFFPTIFKMLYFILKNFRKANAIAKNKYDLAIIGGGQLILSNGNFSASMFLYVFFFKIYGTKVKILSVGVGESFSLMDKLLYRMSFNLVDDIFLRDSESINNFLALFGRKAKYSPDIVYFLADETRNVVNDHHLVCPVEYKVYERYYQEMNYDFIDCHAYAMDWVRIIESILAEKESNIVIISATTISDYNFSSEIFSLLSLNDRKKVKLVQADSKESFITIAEHCRSVTSGRMHALILCHNLGMEIRPYTISSKIKAFKDYYLDLEACTHKKNLEMLRDEIL